MLIRVLTGARDKCNWRQAECIPVSWIADSSNKNIHMAIKTCPECKKQFTCDGDNDCWCEQVQVLKKDMIRIMERYTDCLCPDCLSEYETR